MVVDKFIGGFFEYLLIIAFLISIILIILVSMFIPKVNKQILDKLMKGV
jgi:hypothetical protein